MKTSRLLPSVLSLIGIAVTPIGAPVAHAAQYDQRVASLATRGQVGTGNNIMITGFVVTEGAPKKVLIRAAGQRLSQAPFGITTGFLANPILRVFNSSGQLVQENDNWTSTDNDQAALAAATASAGAFSFGNNANNDSALIATLSTAPTRLRSAGWAIRAASAYSKFMTSPAPRGCSTSQPARWFRRATAF
jgi:hypothetical protein